MIPKNKLSILLSKLKDFDSPSLKLEQYSTPSHIAADILWNAYMNGDIENKIVIDAACGPGILGVGALLLGARKAFFVDKDQSAIDLAAGNIHMVEEKSGCSFEKELICKDIRDVNLKADVVLQNPPFGTKEKHADREFLIKAFDSAPVVYSFHKSSTKVFIEAIAKDNGFNITHVYKYYFPIKATQKFHEKPVVKINIACWRLSKK